MDYTHNKKIMQITETTLIVGVDIAKEHHVARAQDFRGIEFDKPIQFENTWAGMESFLDWATKIAQSNSKDSIIVGMEPTGHYWFNFAQYLKDYGIKVVLVNPFHVKRSKEFDDNCPTKSDLKDPRVIAQLVKDGRYVEPHIPEGVYSDLRVAVELREGINKTLGRVKNKVTQWLDRYFPEFSQVFNDWEGKAALMTLKQFPTPTKIVELGPEEITKRWRTEVKRAVGIKRAAKLVNIAKESGLTPQFWSISQSCFIFLTFLFFPALLAKTFYKNPVYS